MTPTRRALRSLSTVLIISGVLMLADAGLTLVWQEPVSAVYAKIVQGGLGDDLRKLELAKPSSLDLAALQQARDGEAADGVPRAPAARRPGPRRGRRAHQDRPDRGQLRRRQRQRSRRRCARARGSTTTSRSRARPGTTAIAGHRTTYGAPFRKIDQIKRGDEIVVEMRYGTFTYEVEKTQIVKPTALEVIRRVSYDRLVLSACHPLYSAAKRIIVFARLVAAQARGAARI